MKGVQMSVSRTHNVEFQPVLAFPGGVGFGPGAVSKRAKPHDGFLESRRETSVSPNTNFYSGALNVTVTTGESLGVCRLSPL